MSKKKKTLTKGRIPYTSRALLQDAREAMGTDLIRGLIELITNSDDSYARQNRSGPIRVEVDHSRKGGPHEVIVRDRAGGMSFQEMRDRLLPIGGRSSGLEDGQPVRGNRGRGAKDLVAFGEVEFTSIKDGRISSVRLRQTGDFEFSRQDDTPTREERSDLGIKRGNGTVVTVFCEGVRRPRHERLRDDLTNDFQLRDIMADPQRTVTLVGRTKNNSRTAKLRYSRPVLEPLLNTHIEIEGYPEAGQVALTVGKLPERSDDPHRNPTRAAGVLIAGKRAIYDSTLFKFEGHPSAGWLHGRLSCPYIDQLTIDHDNAVESDQAPSDDNPLPIISRRRRGLLKDHPFWTALSKAVEDQLAPLIEKLEEEEKSGTEPKESPEMRRRLDHLGRAVARMLHQSLRELDDDPPAPGPLPDPLVIHPKQANIVVGSTKTLSVVCAAEGLREGDEITIELEPEGAFQIINPAPIRLGPHRSGRSDVLTAPVRLKCLKAESALFEASIGDRSGLALLEGIEEPPPPPPVDPPEDFRFENHSYTLGVNKQKTIEVRGPVALVEPTDRVVQVKSDNAGVTVLDGGTTVMSFNDQLGFYVGRVRIAGTRLGARATLYANLEQFSAQSTVKVVTRDTGIPNLKINFTHRPEPLWRSYFDPEEPTPESNQTLWVAVKHPSLLPLAKDDFSGEHSREFRTALAEVISEALAARLVKKEHGDQPIEVSTLYQRHAQQQTKILPPIQKVLISS
ncbi:MAG: ATP-binding protein [Acidimicrobiia bacterium]|nr:ATP-binding protein [Acidimicrobiia bacterium]